MKIGIQLYTLRDYMEKDFWGTIKKVAQIGFKGIEFAGYYDNNVSEIKKFIDDLGLECISNHLKVPTEDTVDKLCEELSVLGTKDWVANIHGMDTEEGFIDCFNKCEKGAQLLKERGFRLILHNHFWEHISQPFGIPFFEKMLEIDNLYSELDLAWTLAGGYNPVERIKKYNHKILLLHTQDVTKTYNEIWDDPHAIFTAQYSFQQTANGFGDAKVYESIKEANNCQWAIVEINQYVGQMWDGVEKSYEYLIKNCKCEGNK